MKKFILSALAFGPLYAFAASTATGKANLSYFSNILTDIQKMVKVALPIVVALALLFFFWGVAQFILAAGDEEKRKKGQQHMIWGIVGLFVMVAVWGLVSWLGQITGVNGTGGTAQVPSVQGL